MPIRHLTVTGMVTGRLHGGDAIPDQRRLCHQAGAEPALLHPVRGAAHVQVDLVEAGICADPRAGRERIGIGAAELHRERMLAGVIAQQPRPVAVQHRAGGDHLGVEQRPPRQQPVEIPAVTVGPLHHGSDAEAMGGGVQS